MVDRLFRQSGGAIFFAPHQLLRNLPLKENFFVLGIDFMHILYYNTNVTRRCDVIGRRAGLKIPW